MTDRPLTSKLVLLPTWEECKKAVDAESATPLEAFIYENEPALTEKAQDFVRKCIPNYSRRADEQFRGMLSDLIAFVRASGETSVALDRVLSCLENRAGEDYRVQVREGHGERFWTELADTFVERRTERCHSGLGYQGEFLTETQCTLREGHPGPHQYASDPRHPKAPAQSEYVPTGHEVGDLLRKLDDDAEAATDLEAERASVKTSGGTP